MKVLSVLFLILVGVCAAGNLLRGIELVAFAGGEGAVVPLVVGAAASLGFFQLFKDLRHRKKAPPPDRE